MDITLTQHVAGEPQGLVQRCARCGVILIDHTNTMAPEGTTARYWQPGPVVQINNFGWVQGEDEDAAECGRLPAGAN